MAIDINNNDLETFFKLVKMSLPKEVKIYAFGSRVYGKPHKYSDFDIAISGATENEIYQLKEYLSVAPTETRFDISNYDTIEPWLKDIIDEKGEELQQKITSQ